jgi:NAD(P)H dehydrogenase (quinone)
MAKAIQKGVDSVPGCEAVLLQVAETLPAEVLEKMHAPPKEDVPIVNPFSLPEYDGFLFGIPTRFGMMPAQMKAMFDATGGLWARQALRGKPAGVFISVSTQGGGMETTALTTLTQLTHHGCIFVPPGYGKGAAMYDVDNVKGGSPWGSGTFAGGDGSRQPTEAELEYAEFQGAYFAKVAKKLAVKDMEDGEA